jgi:hypothetical protein
MRMPCGTTPRSNRAPGARPASTRRGMSSQIRGHRGACRFF